MLIFIEFYRIIADLTSLVLSKIFFPKSKIIRFPIYLRGSSNIKIGTNFTTGRNCRIEVFKNNYSDATIVIGKNVQINDNVHIACVQKVELGDDTLIASRVFITDHDHGSFEDKEDLQKVPSKRKLISSPVHIGKRVWIGEGVNILKGVKITDNCIIASNSVVTKNCDEPGIYGGVPAKKIK